MSEDSEQPRALSLQEQRVRIQQLEKQTQDEYNAAKEILENDHRHSRSVRTLGKSLPNPPPALQGIVEREQRRLCTLIEQHNGLQFVVRAKESQLLDLEKTMKGLELDCVPDVDEQHYDQRVRQLENCLEKMSIKITEAEKIHNTYLQVRAHLRREVREMPQSLDKLQSTVLNGQMELSKVAEMCHHALLAVDSTKGMLVQMERQLMVERRGLEKELSQRQAEKEKVVEGRLEREREGEPRSSRGPPRLKEQSRKSAREGLAEVTDPAAVRVTQQSTAPPSTPQSLIKLVEDIDALREALSCTDLQELETRLVSQKATQEQLQTQMKQCEQLVEQRQDSLAALELQCARLKFSVGPGSERYEQLKAEMEAELWQEMEHCSQWESKLSKAQAVLHSVEQGVNNLFFHMSCVPMPKESPREGSLNAIDKLQDIDARLPSLKGKVSEQAEDSSLDQEKVWAFLDHSIMLEPKNYRRASSPVYGCASEDTFQFRSQEEDCSLSRDEIKRRGIQLMESHQPKKKAPRGARKS